MEMYPIFLLMAAISIVSPGPSVIMTLTNTMQYGLRGAMSGILGNVTGVITLAIVSATGLGVVLIDSGSSMTIIKYLGAAYLIYFAYSLWRAPKLKPCDPNTEKATFTRIFLDGSAVQLVNPYVIIFFLILVPQFIDVDSQFVHQHLLLTVSYILLQIVILSAYAIVTKNVRKFILSGSASLAINKAGSFAFTFCAAVLIFVEH